MKLTLKKLQDLLKDEKAAAKEYLALSKDPKLSKYEKEGFKHLSADEARHAVFIGAILADVKAGYKKC